MIISYAPGLSRNVPLPASAFWLASTPDNAGGFFSRTVHRSNLLRALDAAIAAFPIAPTIHSFAQIEAAYAAWRRTKLNAQGVVESRRSTATNQLETHLAAHRTWLNACDIVKARVEAGLLATYPWKTHTLCAELYVNANNVNWLPLEARDVAALELEQTASSTWARQAVGQLPLTDWDAFGLGESQRLLLWPNLAAAGIARIRLRDALNIDANLPGQWPPWQNRLPVLAPLVATPNVPFVRKGLFCHSYAALAAHYLFQNRLALVAGTSYRIHAIDVIHQQPMPGGTMSHWWVCVNKPEWIQYATPGPQHQLALCGDFVDKLELAGGFVVDMWGALWSDQKVEGQPRAGPQRAHQRAISNVATAGNCVAAVPEIAFLGNTAATSRGRQVWT